MMKRILDKAEVTLEYPDKLYMGTFESTARFDANFDKTGISLTLDRAGDADTRKSVHMHFHYGLFAEMLHALSKTIAAMPTDDIAHRQAMREAAKVLYLSLCAGSTGPHGSSSRSATSDKMTAEDEVLLLHVLE